MFYHLFYVCDFKTTNKLLRHKYLQSCLDLPSLYTTVRCFFLPKSAMKNYWAIKGTENQEKLGDSGLIQ